MLTSLRLREQRSSSEDSVIKLLQYSPVIYESEDDDALAISAEAFERMQKYKEAAETSDSDRELLCYTAEVKVGFDVFVSTQWRCWRWESQPGVQPWPVSVLVFSSVQCRVLCCLLLFWLPAICGHTAPV